MMYVVEIIILRPTESSGLVFALWLALLLPDKSR